VFVGVAIFLPFRSAIVVMFGSFAISQRSLFRSGERIFQFTPRAQPTRNGPVPTAPMSMSPEMTPAVIGVPEASTFQSTFVPGYLFSIRCSCFIRISGA